MGNAYCCDDKNALTSEGPQGRFYSTTAPERNQSIYEKRLVKKTEISGINLVKFLEKKYNMCMQAHGGDFAENIHYGTWSKNFDYQNWYMVFMIG